VKEKKLQENQVNNFAHFVYLSSIIQKSLLFIQKFALPWQKFNKTVIQVRKSLKDRFVQKIFFGNDF